jgi:hypothetical protein
MEGAHLKAPLVLPLFLVKLCVQLIYLSQNDQSRNRPENSGFSTPLSKSVRNFAHAFLRS